MQYLLKAVELDESDWVAMEHLAAGFGMIVKKSFGTLAEQKHIIER